MVAPASTMQLGGDKEKGIGNPAATGALDRTAVFSMEDERKGSLSATMKLSEMLAPTSEKSKTGGSNGTSTGGNDLKAARESRANEALKMKDDQIRILSEQNAALLRSLDNVEEEANVIQMGKLAAEEENRTLRDQNFEVQSKARAADTMLKKIQLENANKDKQIKILTDQNSELLRLLETEESQTAKLSNENDGLRKDLEALKFKYGSLLTTAKTHEEMAARAAREGQLRAEEVRLLRTETETLKNQNADLRMKTQVEVEALQEQLRVRKEKQYQLLEKLQGEEEAKRQAEDIVAGMEDKMRSLHGKNVELETQLQLETRAKRSQEENNKKLLIDIENFRTNNRELKEKIEIAEQERLRMEAESRDSGEQLREMAEKVFQLLERLKLSELGKTKAMEAMRKKEQEMIALKKKNSRLLKESTAEGKARVQAELDNKILEDQIKALKKHNTQISQRCRDEVNSKLKEHEERKESEEKLKTMGGRLSFLLNKMQNDEESRIAAREEAKKMESQIRSLTERSNELENKLEESGESNRIITQALRLKQEELNQLMIRHEALERANAEYEAEHSQVTGVKVDLEKVENGVEDKKGEDNNGDNLDNCRFLLDSKPALGLILLKGKKQTYREWLEAKDGNFFLKKCQKSSKMKEMFVEKVAKLFSSLMIEEENSAKFTHEIKMKEDKIDHMNKKNNFLQEKISLEEEAKRRTLLRYVHCVKAIANWNGDPPADKGVLQLPDSNVTDEEVHAIAALLKGNTTITELNLRANRIGDEGARALGAVLATRTALRVIDLRGNNVGRQGIRCIAESLERNEKVRHVYVHAGGKIEALGTNSNSLRGAAFENGEMSMMTVETVCVVDVRDNISDDPNQASGKKPTQQSTTIGSPVVRAQSTIPRALQSNKSSTKELMVARASTTDGTSRNRSTDQSDEDLRKAQRRAKKEEAKKIKELEANWRGRAGGMDMGRRESKSQQVRRDLPRINTPGSAYANLNKRATTAPQSNAEKLEHSPLRSPARGGKVKR